MTGPTCGRCGANLASGYLKGSDPNGPPERVCPDCQPDHPFSIAMRDGEARRDPRVADKMTIAIYGPDLPAIEVWTAVSRFVHETFSADWSIDLTADEKKSGGE